MNQLCVKAGTKKSVTNIAKTEMSLGTLKELHYKKEKNLRTQHDSVPLCQDRNPGIQLQDG